MDTGASSERLRMIRGMLWYDGSKDDLNKRVQRAVEYYQKKYEKTPDTCHVHLSELTEQTQMGNILVIPHKGILQRTLWLGVEEKEK